MTSREQTLDWTLRVGAALCFVGHGAFGILQKPAWIAYFAVAGIGPEAARQWMPLVGAWDILMGVVILAYPRPAIALWMVGWALWTAILRPLAGEPVWEALERAGNFGVPLALYLRMAGAGSWRAAFSGARFEALTPGRATTIRRVLTATIVLLLVGHGALSIGGKAAFVHNLASLAGDHASALLPILGWIEIALAAAVALRASVPLLIVVAVWRIAVELLWVTADAPWWEWIERGGSYAAPIALAILITITTARARDEAGSTPRPTS